MTRHCIIFIFLATQFAAPFPPNELSYIWMKASRTWLLGHDRHFCWSKLSWKIRHLCKGTVSRYFLLQVSSQESSSLRPAIIPEAPFRTFWKLTSYSRFLFLAVSSILVVPNGSTIRLLLHQTFCSVIDTCGAHWMANIFANVEHFKLDLIGYSRVRKKDDSCLKNGKSTKSRDSVFLMF